MFDQFESGFLVVRKEVKTRKAVFRILQIVPGVLAAQKSAGQRTPHSQADSRVLHEWNDFVFDVPARQRIVHLTAAKLRKAVRLLQMDCCGSAPCGPVGIAEIAHLSRTNKRIERRDGFLQWGESVL